MTVLSRTANLSLITLTALAAAASGAAVQPPNLDREEIVVVKAGNVITGTGEEIAGGQIVIIDGTIAAVGRSVEYPRTATVVDASDETVMPGMVLLRSRQGLDNYSRSGVRGQLTTDDEVYLELLDFSNLLEAGYTAVALYPAGTGIPGRASVYRTGGPSEKRLVRKDGYLRITMTNPTRDKRVFRDALRRAVSEIEKVEKAREEWERQQQEATENQNNANSDDENQQPQEFKPPDIDAAHKPLVDLLKAESVAPAMIEVNSASDLVHLLDVLGAFDRFANHLYLPGNARDFHLVLDRLAEHASNTPAGGSIIITAPTVRNLPNTVIRHNLVGDLFMAGCEVAAVPAGSGAAAPRSVRRLLADLMRSGLERKEAIRAVTINPARVAAVQNQMGTIESGRDGDLVFFKGDPFDGHSQPSRVMILGEVVWSDNN